MPVIEAQRASILVLHDHRHIKRKRGVLAGTRQACSPVPVSAAGVILRRYDHSSAGSGIWRTLSTNEQGASRLKIGTALNDLDAWKAPSAPSVVGARNVGF